MESLCHGFQDTQVQGRLRNILVQGRSLDQTVGDCHQETDETAAVLPAERDTGNDFSFIRPFGMDMDIRIGHTVFPGNIIRKGLDSLFDLSMFKIACEDDLRLCFPRNGIIAKPSVDTDNAVFTHFFETVKKTCQQNVGIGSAAVDTFAGMTAAKSFYRECEDFTFFIAAFCLVCQADFRSTGAGRCNKSLILRVKVDHPAASESGQIHLVGAQESDFLVDGENAFQRRAGDGLIHQKGQHDCDSNSVITAKRGAVCPDPLSVCH